MATAAEVKANRRALVKRLREENSWLNDWYRDSAGGSVIQDYENGNVVVIDLDKEADEQRAAKEAELSQAETDYEKAKSAVDHQYWLFTRCAKGQPVSAELARTKTDAYEHMMDLRRKTGRAS